MENIWYPWYILNGENNSCQNHNYGIVILNTSIYWKPEFLLPLWNKATLKVTVDGGTNRWFKWLELNNIASDSIAMPHLITGDMDSIDGNILKDIKDKHKRTVVVTPDQNETDFTKALREIHKINVASNLNIKRIIAVADTCGRLDQIMANINTLFLAKTICPETDLFQLAHNSFSWLILKGKHKIFVPDCLRKQDTWCALIPIGQQCDNVTTTGLKWNLDNQTLKFGELISTSNTYSDQPYITIETQKTLLWSMGIDNLFTNGGNRNI